MVSYKEPSFKAYSILVWQKKFANNLTFHSGDSYGGIGY
jgi:hypothetical protein